MMRGFTTQLTYTSPSCRIGVQGPVLLQHWFGAVRLEDAEATLEAHELARRHAPKVDVLVVVEGLPGAARRRDAEAFGRADHAYGE